MSGGWLDGVATVGAGAGGIVVFSVLTAPPQAVRRSEIEAILTPEQKKILQALVDSKDDKKDKADDKAEPAKEAKK